MSADPEHAIPRHPGGALPPKRQLQEITSSAPEITDPLDLVHVTSAGWAQRVLDAGQLEVRQCSIFKKDLLYFFVSQSAYRSEAGTAKTDKLAQFPTAFVLVPEELGTPYHVYPFDTGAAATGRFPDARMDGVYLEDYALENNISAAQRLISWAFGTHANYLQRELRHSVGDDVNPWQFAVDGYLRIARLASVTRNDRPDTRASAIEIAYARNIPLKGVARFLVLPVAMLESPKNKGRNTALMARAEELGIELVTYEWRENDAPNWHMAEIERLVRARLRTTPE